MIPELLTTPTPLIVSVEGEVPCPRTEMTNGLAPASKAMLFTSVFAVSEMLVVVETSKVAVSNGPLGTVSGVQFAGAFQSLLVGLRSHVALPA